MEGLKSEWIFWLKKVQIDFRLLRKKKQRRQCHFLWGMLQDRLQHWVGTSILHLELEWNLLVSNWLRSTAMDLFIYLSDPCTKSIPFYRYWIRCVVRWSASSQSDQIAQPDVTFPLKPAHSILKALFLFTCRRCGNAKFQKTISCIVLQTIFRIC